MERRAVIIGGPTGVGKTSLSINLAKELKADIISADSAQVYRGLDIGTAKIRKEEMQGIKHHLLDVVEPTTKYSVGEFAEATNAILQEKYKKKENILLVGGTGLYLSAVSDGLSSLPPADLALRTKFMEKTTEELYQELLTQDVLSANTIHPNNRVRATACRTESPLPYRQVNSAFTPSFSTMPSPSESAQPASDRSFWA